MNADATSSALDAFAASDAPRSALLSDAAVKLNMTARGYHRVLKVSRTIADLEGSDAGRRIHIAEALTYWRRDPAEIGNASASAATGNGLVY